MSDHDDNPRDVTSRYADDEDPTERDETPGERLDRQWNELLQEHRKDTIVAAGHVMAKIGLALLAATIVAVSWLTFGFVLGDQWGPVGAGAAVVVFVGLWVILPLSLRSRRDT